MKGISKIERLALAIGGCRAKGECPHCAHLIRSLKAEVRAMDRASAATAKKHAKGNSR